MASLDDFSFPRSLHPLTLVQQFLRSLPALLILLAPTILRGSAGETRLTLTFAFMYAVVVVPLIIIRYLRFRYWIEDDEVVIHSGVFTRRKRNIPMDRIQNIEIQQPLLPRLMGMAQVRLDTAGSSSSEGQLEYVALEEAQAIRKIVREFQRAETRRKVSETVHSLSPHTPVSAADLMRGTINGTAESDAEDVQEEDEEERVLLFSMPSQRVLLMGAYRFSFLFIVLILSAVQYLQLDPEELADLLFRGPFRDAADVVAESPWLYGSMVVFTAAFLSWLTGIITTFVQYFGFHLWLDDDKLQRKHGLLTLQEGTIPLHRVQTLILRSNPLMEWRRWFRLELQTMGYDVDEQGYHVVVPFAQKDTIAELSPEIRPIQWPESFHSVSPITIRRHFIRYTVLLLIVVLPIAQFWSAAYWGLTLIPFLALFAWLHYLNHGYATDGNWLFIRRGVVRRYTFALPLDKMQVFMTSASIFQRRLGLKSLSVDTAGSRSVNYPEIVDVPEECAEVLLKELTHRFRHYFEMEEEPSKRNRLLTDAADVAAAQNTHGPLSWLHSRQRVDSSANDTVVHAEDKNGKDSAELAHPPDRHVEQ